MKPTKKKSLLLKVFVLITGNFRETKEVLRKWVLDIIENQPELYPKGVAVMLATPDDNSFTLSLHLGNELGRIIILVDMKYVNEKTVLEFKSYLITEKSSIEKHLLQDDLSALESKYVPVVNSFLAIIADLDDKQEE